MSLDLNPACTGITCNESGLCVEPTIVTGADTDCIDVQVTGIGTVADPFVVQADLTCESGDAVITVAAFDTIPEIANFADFTCSGANDQVEINDALALVGPNGSVVLLTGTFNLSGNVVANGRTLRGEGSPILNFTGNQLLFADDDGVIKNVNVILSGGTVSGANRATVTNVNISGSSGTFGALQADGNDGYYSDIVITTDAGSSCVLIFGSRNKFNSITCLPTQADTLGFAEFNGSCNIYNGTFIVPVGDVNFPCVDINVGADSNFFRFTASNLSVNPAQAASVAGNDNLIMYTTCGDFGPDEDSGTNNQINTLTVHTESSDCISVTGSGSVSAPIMVEPILNSDECNLIECTEEGLLVTVHAATGVTGCIAVTGCGTEEDPLTVDLIIDPDANNILECRENGIFVPSSSGDHDHNGTYVATADLAASGKGWVNHGDVADTARPTGYASIEWFGSVEPTNALDGDTWVEVS